MMTRELEVSILAAPLLAIDRRVLSQAWYSALGLAPQPRRLVERCERHAKTFAYLVERGRRLGPSTQPVKADSRPASTPQRAANRPSREGVGAHPRSPRAPLAVRIERAFAAAPARPKRATFSLGRGNARVHVLLQTKANCTILVALCRPEVRTIVGGALAEARVALAARGIGLRVRLRGDLDVL